jgi:hypothetical protein
MNTEEVQVTEEIQINTKLFKEWRKKSGYQYVGPTYTNMGPTFTNRLPAHASVGPVPNSFAEERHWTPIEVAKQWGVSSDLIRSLFRNEPGVLMFDRPATRAKRSYATMRIPDSVLVRVHTRMSSRATVLK